MSADTRQALAALLYACEEVLLYEDNSVADLDRLESAKESARAALAAQPVAGAVAPHELMRHVRRLMAHVDEWQRWYGSSDVLLGHQLPLPPAGTVRIMEDLDEAIRGAAPAHEPSAQAVAHPSHQTVREWMPVSEALRLSDLWTAGDLDNCGQWRAAIKVLADEVRALAASPQPEPSAQGEPVASDRDAPVCPWCDRQGWDICQHADDARTCGK